MLLKLETFANIATKCFNCHQEEGKCKKQTNKQTILSRSWTALCLLASYHLGVWIRSSVCFIAFPCRNVAASIQVFKVWRAILPVFLLLSHIQDSWRVLSSSPLSAVLLPFLQKSVFVAAVLTLPTPLSHIYIPNQVFIMDIEQMVMKSSCTLVICQLHERPAPPIWMTSVLQDAMWVCTRGMCCGGLVGSVR